MEGTLDLECAIKYYPCFNTENARKCTQSDQFSKIVQVRILDLEKVSTGKINRPCSRIIQFEYRGNRET